MAPGTWGTLAGIPIYLALSRLPLWGYLAGLALLVWAAVFVAGRAQEIFGRHDDPRIVIDEAAGYLVTMVGAAPGLRAVVLGFIFFRVFDILKPWPCRAIDKKWVSGAGVVFDDVAAGIYGALALQATMYIWPSLGRG